MHYKIPSVGTIIEKVFCDMDPDEGVDDQYKSTNDKVYTWKCLRTIAHDNLMRYNNQAKCYDIEHLTLEYVRQRNLL